MSQPRSVGMEFSVGGLLAAAVWTALCPGLGAGADAAVFVFSQQCATPNWVGECTAGACVPTGTQTFNNWGQSGCASGLALPGAGDTADISGAAVTLNGTVSVLEVLTSAGTGLTWASGSLSLGQPSTMNGSVLFSGGGTRNLTGTLTNTGTWGDDGSLATLFLSSANLTNAASGAWTITGGSLSRFASSTNSFVNAGTLTKTGGATSALTQIALTNAGVLQVAGGTLNITQSGWPVTFSPGSTTTVAAGATLTISEGSLSGVLTGTNDGTFNLATPTLAGALTINLPGNPVTWTGGNINGGGNTLTVEAGTDVAVTGAAVRTISSGNIVNHGVWTESTGGSSTSFSSSTFVNNGTLGLAGQSWLRSGSSNNSVTNNGTWNKSTATLSTVQSIAVNQNGTLNVLEGAMTIAGTFPLNASAASLTNTAAGTTLTLGCPITGDIEGTNSGTVILSGMTLAGDATINMGPGLVQMQTSSTALNGHTLTIGPATRYRNVTGVTKTFSGGSIINNGDWLEATGGFVTNLSSVHITNNGTMTLDGTTINRFGSSSNSITNNGTLRKIGANSVSIVEMHLVNNGLIDVEQGNLSRGNTFTFTQNPGGTLRARAGTIVNMTGTVWNGGTLRGLGIIQASNFSFNPAPMTITPGDPGDEGGLLSLQGSVVMSNDDVLNIELDARPGTPAGHDRVHASGTMHLGGATLNVSLAPGFTPVLGDQYTIASWGIQSAESFFGTINYNLPDDVLFSIQYFNNSNFVRLTVIGVPCGTADFDGDGDLGTDADIEAFFACLSGNCCGTCYAEGADFNADGDIGTDQDIESFFRVLAGGAC